jgi:hypothetical protein
MVEAGFKAGKSSPCIFRDDPRDITVVVHGDDFTILADDHGINYVIEMLKQKYQIKVRGILGEDAEDLKEIRILNRVLRWTQGGLEYEADPRHAEIIVKALGVEKGTGVSTPGVKKKFGDPLDENKPDGGKAKEYRQIMARGNYLAQDRPDIMYAVKELTRGMSAPSEADWIALKRLAR